MTASFLFLLRAYLISPPTFMSPTHLHLSPGSREKIFSEELHRSLVKRVQLLSLWGCFEELDRTLLVLLLRIRIK